MSTAEAISAHIAYDVIEHTKHRMVVIEFKSDEIINPACALELGEQLESLVRPGPRQYVIIDCAGVRSLGSAALAEIVSFVRRSRPVWVCNLHPELRLKAALVGLDNWARFAANRHAAVNDAGRTARWDEEDAAEYPARARC